MPAKSSSKTSGKNASVAGKRPGNGHGKTDAEALLRADHRKVEGLFKKYEGTESSAEKKQLAKQICSELIVHTTLEEEIFYPACREADVEDDALDEAQVEHDGAKVLVAELMTGSPSDEYYDAKVKVLSEYIKHHVGEEEEPKKGIFAKARKAGVDMAEAGAAMQARKAELTAAGAAATSKPPQPRSLHLKSSGTAVA